MARPARPAGLDGSRRSSSSALPPPGFVESGRRFEDEDEKEDEGRIAS